MTLFQRLAELENISARLETKLGVPQRRFLLIRRISRNLPNNPGTVQGQDFEYQDTLINPPPIIQKVSKNQVGLVVGGRNSNITVSEQDLYCEIPRTWPYSTFVNLGLEESDRSRNQLIIDPSVNSQGQVLNPVGGRLARILSIQDDDPTVWKMILTLNVGNTRT